MTSGAGSKTSVDQQVDVADSQVEAAAPQVDNGLDEVALEAAIPTLTEKLSSMSASLTEDERTVLSSIITSASLHLKQLQDVNFEANYSFAKPISAAATPSIRAQLLDLPEALGFTE